MVSQHALQEVSQHALQRGVPAPRGVPGPGGSAPRGMSAPGGCLVETPGRLVLRAVRILLECILVVYIFAFIACRFIFSLSLALLLGISMHLVIWLSE